MRKHPELPLWEDCDRTQARGVLQRNKVSGRLLTEAVRRFNDPNWAYGPNLYLLDTLTGCAARLILQGPDEYDVRIATSGAEQLFDDLAVMAPALVDKIVILD